MGKTEDITIGDGPKLDGEVLGQNEAEELTLPSVLPVLPARGVLCYPHVVIPVAVQEERDVKLLNDAILSNRLMVFAAVREDREDPLDVGDVYHTGCAVMVVKMMRFPDETTRFIVQGLSRVRIERFTQTDPYFSADIRRLESVRDDSLRTRALARTLTEQFQRLVDLSTHLPEELKVAALNLDDYGRLADVVSTALSLDITQRQHILETLNVAERLELVNAHVRREVQTAELSSKIQSQVKTELDDDQRKFILRRQLKAIQSELGETDPHAAEVADLRKRVKALKLPEEAQKEADRELERLERMPPQAPEYHVAHTYIDWVIALPWSKSTRDRLDVSKAEKVLNADHYDLERVKTRVLEYLAVRKLRKDIRGPILCFVGPPGTGKTSLGQSIARALGRKFVRISLGGVRDEAAIRGHRRTYVGALPGRIVQGLRKAESKNPVFMLDEIDKLGTDFRGDPAAALLEVLDPEQNSTFTDHYLDVPFDLSQVMFITTANILDPVPPALRDRMEILELPGYTTEEKIGIAKQYLVPRQIEENGLKPTHLEFTDDVLMVLIRSYTREAGLRNLERQIGTLCRKHAVEVVRKKGRRKKRVLSVKDVGEMLGPARFYGEVAERTAEPGIATGLAWTTAGGDILFIEATQYAGNGRLLLTGQLGNVMKESAQAALSFLRARSRQLGIPMKDFGKRDIHIHVPAGAIPKDGPSGGVTIIMALASLFTGIPVKPDVAMSGEITLRGRVLAVGGIKEKVLAAQRAGIKTVILPKRNEKDLADVPETARKAVEFVFVETVDQAFPHVFSDGSRATRPSKKNPVRSKSRRKTSRKSS